MRDECHDPSKIVGHIEKDFHNDPNIKLWLAKAAAVANLPKDKRPAALCHFYAPICWLIEKMMAVGELKVDENFDIRPYHFFIRAHFRESEHSDMYTMSLPENAAWPRRQLSGPGLS